MTDNQLTIPGVDPPERHPSADHMHAEDRAAFELAVRQNPATGQWADRYAALVQDMGPRHWRRAAYVAWLCVPAQYRQPATKRELASLLGLRSTRRLARWDKQPSTQALVLRFTTALATVDHFAELVEHTIEAGRRGDMVGYYNRKLYFELIGAREERMVVQPAATDGPVDMSKLSTDELRQMVAEDLIEDDNADAIEIE